MARRSLEEQVAARKAWRLAQRVEKRAVRNRGRLQKRVVLPLGGLMQTSLNSPLPSMISATVAAAMVGVCTNTLDAYTKTQGFPRARWIGGRKNYRTDEVHAWLLSPDRFKSTRICGEAHHNNRWPKEFVGQAIALYNGGTGLSLGQIAIRLGVPKATIQKWVDGSRRSVDVAD